MPVRFKIIGPALAVLLTAIAARADTPPFPDVTITAQDRILILAPHPDDEVLGNAGIIQQALAVGAPVYIAFLTLGDNYEWAFMAYRRHPILSPAEMRRMGEVRRGEALHADDILGVPPDRVTFLGYPDWGTLPIWTRYWGDVPPFRSMLTRVTAVPYPEALRPGALYRGQDIVRDLETVIKDAAPTKVFVSHPGDAHRDHLALYLYTRVALWDLQLTPQLFPYLIHFKNWPPPLAHGAKNVHQPMAPPAALLDQGEWMQYPLTEAQQAQKRRALEAHATQFHYDRKFLSNFLRTNEIFGEFPDITIKGDASPKDLSAGRHQDAKMAAPEEMTPDRQEAFTGIDWRTLSRQDDDLIVTLSLSRKLRWNAHASVFICGWRPDEAFSAMPKLNIRFSAFGYAVYDQKKRLAPTVIKITHEGTLWKITVPLAALGRPTRLLMGARTALGNAKKRPEAQTEDKSGAEARPDTPLDWAAWRSIILE